MGIFGFYVYSFERINAQRKGKIFCNAFVILPYLNLKFTYDCACIRDVEIIERFISYVIVKEKS